MQYSKLILFTGSDCENENPSDFSKCIKLYPVLLTQVRQDSRINMYACKLGHNNNFEPNSSVYMYRANLSKLN